MSEFCEGPQTNNDLHHEFTLIIREICTAIAIAIEASVTVSIGDEQRGAFRDIFFVNAELKSYNKNREHMTSYAHESRWQVPPITS